MFSRRQFLKGLAVCTAGTTGFGGYAVAEPWRTIGTRYRVSPPGWPRGLRLKLAVLADIHASEPWMPVERIEEIAHRTNAAEPDAVLLLGDYVTGHQLGRLSKLVAHRDWARALGHLKAPLGVHAVLGNHDVEDGRQDQLQYQLFNMRGRNYYTLKQGDDLVELFMLDSTDFDNSQHAWVEQALSASSARWKIAVFHHPIHSSGDRHGSNPGLRSKLEPLFTKYNVNAVFSGHDHIYERTKPQQGIQYFVTGAGGKTRRGGVDLKSPIRQASFDQDNHFMVIEIKPQQIVFQAVSETGALVDNGINPNLLRIISRGGTTLDAIGGGGPLAETREFTRRLMPARDARIKLAPNVALKQSVTLDISSYKAFQPHVGSDQPWIRMSRSIGRTC